VTEIRTVVDLHHPPGRVWRALTDRRLLPQWLATLEPRAGARFQLRPVDLPGLDAMIDGELVAVDEPHRMVMRWQENDRRSLVVCELTPTPDGCRLSFSQTCESGEWEPADRDRRQQTLDDFLTGRLPAVLDWLALREVDLADTVVIAAVEADADPVEPDAGAVDRRPRRRWLIATTLAACLLTAIVVTVMGMLRPASDHAAGAAGLGPAPSPSGAAPTTTEAVPIAPPRTNHADPIRSTSRPTPSPTKNTTAATVPATAALGAHYATVSNRLFGYSAQVIVNNPSQLAVPGWVLTITLSGRSQVYSVSGANYHQNGQTVIFTGPPIPPNGSAHIRFDVAGDARLGDKRPGGCAIDGQPCAGM
jgi:uncharacterized protein YndB with AHSA1/START domain